MKTLLYGVLFLCLGTIPAFAGSNPIVNSVKYEVTKGVVMPYPAVNIFGLQFVDPDTGYIEKDIPFPGKSTLIVDGTFLFHTKLSYDETTKLSTIEGDISSLGASAVDEFGNKYLIKGDYRFNFENFITKSSYIEVYGTIPFRLVDANSGHEYILNGRTSLLCEPSAGCSKYSIEFLIK